MKGVYKGKQGYTGKTGEKNIKNLFSDETEEGVKLNPLSKEYEKAIMELD